MLVAGRKWIYRGMRDSTWGLRSSFHRFWGSMSQVARARLHQDQLEELRRAIGEHLAPTLSLEDPQDPELEAFGQHYDMPTLLLDWSRNPLVAAFFACADSARNFNNTSLRLVVCALRTDSPVWNDQQGCVQIVQAKNPINERVVRQMGLFTYDRSGKATIEEYVRSALDDEQVVQDVTTRGPVIRKVTFPLGVVAEALEELEVFSINSYAMFPDHTGVVRQAQLRIIMRQLRKGAATPSV